MPLPSVRTLQLLQLIDVQRADWDPNDDAPAKNREVEVIDTFELHHTGGPGPRSLSFADKLAWGEAIERFHEDNKGWTDIFYHVFVFADGEVWGGRRPDRTSQGDIPTTLTVHVPGNNPPITAAQFVSLLELARWCTDDPDHLTTHTWRAAGTSRPTACPGSNGIAAVLRLREELTMPTSADLLPEDLSDHEDAKAAVAKGLIGTGPAGLEGGRVASRSVVAITANRADDQARAREARLQAALNTLTTRLARQQARIDGLLDRIQRLENAPSVEAKDVLAALGDLLRNPS